MSGSKATLLLEIGCEEIPARMLDAAAADLGALVVAILERAGLPHGAPRPLHTARRLALLLPGVGLETPRRSERLLGPPAKVAWDAEDQPTKALAGFARKQGLPLERFERVETERGEYAGTLVERGGEALGALLADALPREIARMSFPKAMRWGEGRHRFVRPVHWLVAMAGEEVLPLELFGVGAGRETRGHRSLAPGALVIGRAEDYEELLEERGRVTVDPVRRAARLEEGLREAAEAEGGRLADDPALLEESVGIVELPGALVGAFDERFVESLPFEVLRTCLRHHQKAFLVVDGEGRAQPRFGVAVNVAEDPAGHVRRGHEWVVSGRLEDALFFWSEDRRRPLAERVPELEGVIFHQRLGSYAAKARRVAALSAHLAAALGLGTEAERTLARAAELCRADLVTGLVGEFPELQGVVGALLARAEGEPEKLAAALYDLYRPASADDALPATTLGRVLGLADRLDTLAGGFLAGLEPSGSRDPFALRRAGSGAMMLALSLEGLDLLPALEAALGGYAGGQSGPDLGDKAAEARPALVAFLHERFAAIAEREGARYDELAAVRAAVGGGPFVPSDLMARIAALRGIRGSEDFLALASASKRVRNILAQAAERGERPEEGNPDGAGEHPAESALARAVHDAEDEVRDALASGDHASLLARVAALRPEVDRFFDEVLVMDEQRERRLARLALLARIHRLSAPSVDLAEIVVEGHERR